MQSESHTAVAHADVPAISRAEIKQHLNDHSLVLVDVLSSDSYANGHLPGAISLPFDQIESRAREQLPDPNAEIAVYCAKFT
ncbi:MAG TPA: rhodanese-like domain-containing protein [Candidatus Binataceae bacterium]|nr:rhodanese-like domain-containing protein [Candidatus Binataceae bacterium]